MNELQTKQLAFLDETVKHFNSTNRGLSDEGDAFCSYVGGCAIGRFLSPEVAERFDDDGRGIDVLMKEELNLIPENLKELGGIFLQAIQYLHDIEENWDESGLSEYGKKSYEVIRMKILETKIYEDKP